MSQLKGLLADLREEVPRIKAGADLTGTPAHDSCSVRAGMLERSLRVGWVTGCPSIRGWRDSGGEQPEGAGECRSGDASMREAAGAPVAAVHAITWPGLAAGVAPLSGGGGGGGVGGTSEEDEPAGADSRREGRGWPGQGWWLRLSGVDSLSLPHIPYPFFSSLNVYSFINPCHGRHPEGLSCALGTAFDCRSCRLAGKALRGCCACAGRPEAAAEAGALGGRRRLAGQQQRPGWQAQQE